MLSTLLAPYRDLNEMKMDDLVHHAADLVPQVAGPQNRYKVTPIPDARTVRYYIQEGLVDPAHGSSGAASLYGYRHLLQLVTVKVLQGHNLPIRKIRETIDKLTDRELEKLLKSWRGTPSAADPTLSAHAYLRSLERSENPGAPAAEPRRAAYEGWTAHELYPGIELRVKDDLRIPMGTSFYSALASRMRVILERLMGGKP